MKKLAILQSSYIPWKGYFDIIHSADEFMLLDDVQYTRHDWRNRNVVKGPQGVRWLTISVDTEGKLTKLINQIHATDPLWGKRHWEIIRYFYRKAPYFQLYAKPFGDLYLANKDLALSHINYRFISLIARILGIKTKITWSTDYARRGRRSERVVDLCLQAKATDYITGSSAKAYLDESLFSKRHIRVRWVDYSGYPQYQQLYPPFVHTVSILDLLFNEGPKAADYMKTFTRGNSFLSP